MQSFKKKLQERGSTVVLKPNSGAPIDFMALKNKLNKNKLQKMGSYARIEPSILDSMDSLVNVQTDEDIDEELREPDRFWNNPIR